MVLRRRDCEGYGADPMRIVKINSSRVRREGRQVVRPVKALVWFWIIDETLVLTSILSVCRLNEVGTCQVMEQVMIMVVMVMTTR